MADLVLAANPIIETLGEVGAIIICLFLFIFVIVAVGFNLAMTFGMGWVREKIDFIKMLRPHVESINKATEGAAQGIVPAESENGLVRTVASVPLRLQDVDRKIDQTSERVASAVIEFRARTAQVRTVAQAFLVPKSLHKEQAPKELVDEQGLEFNSPGYRKLMEERASEIPVSTGYDGGYRPSASSVTASQLRDVPTH